VPAIPPLALIATSAFIGNLNPLCVVHLRRPMLPRDVVRWHQFLMQARLTSVIPFTLVACAERSITTSLAAID
jgi:hypothetical protein